MASFFDCFNNFLQSGGNVTQYVQQEDEQKAVAQPLVSDTEPAKPATPTPSESVSWVSFMGAQLPVRVAVPTYAFPFLFIVKFPKYLYGACRVVSRVAR